MRRAIGGILKCIGVVVVVGTVEVVGARSVAYAFDTEHNIWVDENPHVRSCKHECTCNGGIYRAGRLGYITGDWGHPNPNWKGGQ